MKFALTLTLIIAPTIFLLAGPGHARKGCSARVGCYCDCIDAVYFLGYRSVNGYDDSFLGNGPCKISVKSLKHALKLCVESYLPKAINYGSMNGCHDIFANDGRHGDYRVPLGQPCP